MGFLRRAFLNALKGGGITVVVIVGLFGAGMIWLAASDNLPNNLPKPGWRERLDVILVAAATWGALTGFCCTRPDRSSKITSALLVLLAMVLSLPIPFAIDLAIDGRVDNIADTLGFALLSLVPLAGFVCGIEQFYEQKAADKAE